MFNVNFSKCRILCFFLLYRVESQAVVNHYKWCVFVGLGIGNDRMGECLIAGGAYE